MALSPCTEFSGEEQTLLLQLARQAIGQHFTDAPENSFTCEREVLKRKHGVFVTLTRSGALRGCIGTLDADQPLSESVPDCARGAAFRDPRFTPLHDGELDELRVEISILTQPQSMQANDRADLLAQLDQGTDGLLIVEGSQRATFLPQVWEQLPQPEEFLSHLMRKAGLPADYWSDQLRCSRYQCIKFSEPG